MRHTIERDDQSYYVVNACLHFHLRPSRPSLVLTLRDSRVAVLVDRIEHMTEITTLHALPQAFSGEERGWYRGLALVGERVVPVVDPAGFLTEREMETLEATSGAARAAKHPVAGGVSA